ncbi:helix-hairpin-helix domain-containing protein [Streptomyces sp. NPDC056105]|uniref:helix-hairpin-helix domain-containing protein n=1 Tax=Streptomyces sp. NPDC056105 TaxID=3345714 RepID=UPI0035D613FA
MGRALARTLAADGFTYANLSSATDADLERIPGITRMVAARIREGFPAPGVSKGLLSLRKHAANVSRETGLEVSVEPFGSQYALTVAHPVGRTRHGGYTFDAIHGMLLGIAAASGPTVDGKGVGDE